MVIVSAVPAWALLKIVPDLLLETEPYFQPLKKLSYAPILSIHLWFDQKITDDLFTGLLDTHIQWLFNRSHIHRDARTKEGYVSLVISGAHGTVYCLTAPRAVLNWSVSSALCRHGSRNIEAIAPSRQIFIP